MLKLYIYDNTHKPKNAEMAKADSNRSLCDTF